MVAIATEPEWIWGYFPQAYIFNYLATDAHMVTCLLFGLHHLQRTRTCWCALT